MTIRKASSSLAAADFRLAEYEALRGELLKRVEIRYQLVLATLVGAGTFLSIGVQFFAAPVVLSFPILVALLAAAWASNDLAIKRIAAYISTRIETVVADDHQGWEHSHPTSRIHGPFGNVFVYATRAIFVVTQVLTIIAGVAVGPISDPRILALVAIDALVVAVTVLVLEGQKVTFDEIEDASNVGTSGGTE